MQTSYEMNQGVANAGGLYDIGEHDIVSGVAAEEMEAGLGVAQGATDSAVKLPSASTDKFKGVIVCSMTKEMSANGDVKLAAKASVDVIRKGRVWVKVEQDVAALDKAFVVFNGAKGLFRKDANTDKAMAFNGVFMTSALAGGLAVLDINL